MGNGIMVFTIALFGGITLWYGLSNVLGTEYMHLLYAALFVIQFAIMMTFLFQITKRLKKIENRVQPKIVAKTNNVVRGKFK